MKIGRFLVIMLVFAGMATFNPADAQFKKLRKRGKDKIEQKAQEKKREKERKLEAKVDQKLDEAVEGAEDSAQEAAGNVFERKAEEMMAEAMGPVEEPFVLGPNATGNANASFVMYRAVTKLEMSGMENLPKMFEGMMTVNEVHYIHDGTHRTDSRGSSTVLDASGRRFINILHPDETFSIRTFQEMADLIATASSGDSVPTDVDPAHTAEASEMKVSVKEMGETTDANGMKVDRRVLIIEGDYETTSDTEQNDGKFFFIIDALISQSIAGHKTISDTNLEIAKEMGSAFGTTGNSFSGIMGMMNQDSQAHGQMGDALAELKKMGGGLAVRSDTYMVQAPRGATLDLDKVLAGNLSAMTQEGSVRSQETVMIIRSNVGDLNTDRFELGLLGPPAAYTEIEYVNPFENAGMPAGMPGQ